MQASNEQRARRPTAAHGPSVDVVVNNHNYGRFLGAAVDSALAQSHPHVRVIVVDDGSTDDSREILRAYGERIEVILKENGGQASALNAGFARSEGNLVIFLDSDDVLYPDAATRVAAAFATDPDLVKVQYRMQVIDEHGEATGALKPSPHLPLPGGDVRRAEMVSPFDLVWLPTSGNAFRAGELRRIMPIPESDFRSCPDWYLIHLASLLGKVASLEDVCAAYRVHGGNSYELSASEVDLRHVRQAILYSDATRRALDKLVGELQLQRPYQRILSVSEVSNRMVSLRLEPELHPFPSDKVRWLLLDGVRAAARRSDVAWPMKVLYIGWLLAAAVAPRWVVRRLARLLLFPQRRRRLNTLLQRLQHR
jgi:glycosyltransferase involved in cell wall biosynthesis